MRSPVQSRVPLQNDKVVSQDAAFFCAVLYLLLGRADPAPAVDVSLLMATKFSDCPPKSANLCALVTFVLENSYIELALM